MKTKQLLSVIIAIFMVIGMIPAAGLTAFADGSAEPEVYWGTSSENLIGSGTFEEFNMALDKYYFNGGNEVSYAKLAKDINSSITIYPMNTLTIDLAGCDITSDLIVFNCQPDCNFTVIDSEGGGAVTTSSSAVLYSKGAVTVSGNITLSGTGFTIMYIEGTLDLSGWSNAEGVVILNSAPDLAVSDTTIKLPEGYSFLDDDGDPITILMDSTSYTVGEVSGDPVPVVTNVDFNRSSPAYNSVENMFYVSDAHPFELTVTGENLTAFNDMGGLKALFYGDSPTAGGVITNISIHSDTEASISIGTSSLSYIFNNSFGSSKIESVEVRNGDTRCGDILYVGIKHAPTFELKIKDSIGGTVNYYNKYVAVGTTVNLTVTPDSGKMLESLIVDGTDVTNQVSGDTYTFTMPARTVWVEATFKDAPKADVSIMAVDIDYGYELPDAHIQLLDKKGDVVEEWDSVSGAKNINGLEVDAEYILHVTVAPDGYIVPADTQLEVDAHGNITYSGNKDGDVLLVEFTKTVVRIAAVDTTNGNEISGAAMQVIEIEGNTGQEVVLDEWISYNGAYEIVGLNTRKEYTIRAVVAPDGYIIPTETKFTIDEDGDLLTYGSVDMYGTILLEFDRTKALISAVDRDDSSKLEGATIQILDGNGIAVEEWVSAFEVKTVEGLKTGVPFTLHVTVAPDGYKIPDDADFSIDANGEVTYVGTTTTDLDGNTVLLIEFETEAPLEAIWGADADNLPYSGSLQQAIDAAMSDSSIQHIKLQSNIDIGDSYYFIDEGNFTIDLNGKNVSSNDYTFYIINSGTKVTFIDGAAVDGTVRTTHAGCSAVTAAGGAEVMIDGGNYIGGSAVFVDFNGSVTIKDGKFESFGQFALGNSEGTLIIEGGNFITGKWASVSSSGNATISDGSFTTGSYGTFLYGGDTLDLSGYALAPGMTVVNFAGENVTVSDTTIKLSQDYYLLDDNGIAQPVLSPYTSYTIGKVTEYTVTFIDWNDKVLKTETVEKGKGATAPVNPTREGWEFKGWDKAFDNITSDLTVEAVYTEKPAIVITLPEQDYTYTGEEIKPVPEVKEGTTLLVEDTDYEVTYQDNVNVGKAKVIVTFKGNYSGTAEKEFTILEKQIDSKLNITAPVKNVSPQTEITGEGYTGTVEWSPTVTDKFGYNTEYTATITITTDSNHTTEGITSYPVEGAKSVSISGNVVTVVFEKTGVKTTGGFGGGGGVTTYTVKFETDGGSKVASRSVAGNTKLAEPEAPVKEGFEFAGWYTEKEFTNAYDFEARVTKNFTLYAKWIETEANKDDDNQETSGHNCPSLKFDDLDISQWYHLDTDYVLENDIFKGTTEKTFTPHGNITRAMMITVLYRAEGEPDVTGKVTFEDVGEDTYYAKAVLWGQQNGIVKGYSDTEYAPEQPILREQIAAIMHRYAKFKGIDVSVGENTNILSYEDADKVSEYAIPSMQWAVGSGMIKGRTEKTLNPLDFAERVEIAAMLHRFIENNK